MKLFLLGLLLVMADTVSFTNSTGTFGCYYRCQSCTDVKSSSCSSCYANYVLTNNSCLPCADNCLSCVEATGLCQSCASQFYLSQSTWTCNPCPTGAQICTFSAIQQCLPGYYLINSICLFCIANCQTCSDAYSCSVCNVGYYLTSQQACAPCAVSYCSSCDQSGQCQLCSNNRYGAACDQLCPSFCEICDSQICYQCASGYYLSSTGSCEALSIICQTGIAPFQCQTCLSIGYIDGSNCYPYSSVHLTNIQSYYQPLNQGYIFSGTLQNCDAFWMSEGSEAVSINISVNPSYMFAIKVQIMTLLNQTTSIAIGSNSLKETFNGSIVSSFGYKCLNQSWVISNFIANFTPTFTTASSLQSLQLVLEGSPSIGVGQVLVEQFLCLVDNCGLCLSAYSCLSCLSPYLLENNQCMLECSSGYYYTQKLMTCTLTCPSGFFPNLADYSCTSCVSPCFTCKSSTQCLSCEQGWYLLDFACLSSCPTGYYQNNNTRICAACQYPCSACSNTAFNCTSCSIGFLSVSTGSCFVNCPSGSYSNFTTITCDTCSATCSSCEFSRDHCTSCASPLFLNPNSTCLSSCDSTYAENIVRNSCEKCEYPCRTCNTSSTDCLTCFAGYLQGSRCVSACSVGTYNDFQFKQCLACPANCSSCISKLQCSSCIANYYYSPTLHSCSLSCPNSSYPDSNFTCTLCRSPCSTCLNATFCLSCQGYLFVYNSGKCLLSCSSGTFVVLNSTTNIKYCAPCGTNCSVCLSAEFCISCIASSLSAGNCVSQCPAATYEWNGVCSRCSFPCFNCSSSDICLSCQSGYFYYSKSNSCLKICPGGYYASQQLCLPCNSLCSLCTDASVNCLTCANGYFKTSNGSCSSSCGFGEYPYSLQNVCKKCSSPCLECISGSLCTSCDTSSIYPYRHRYSCGASCPNGFFANSNFTCQQCNANCLSCSKSENNCTQCDSDHYFLSSNPNQCVTTCPSKYYPNSAAFCTPCLPPCDLCESQSVCISCISQSYFLYNGNCLSSCPFGFYSSVNTSNCLLCSQSCLECASFPSNCTHCAAGLYLTSINGSYFQCISTCPSYFYPDVVNQICLACIAPCLLCYSSSRCISCTSGFYLQFDTCLKNCLSGYYIYGLNCTACLSPCATCSSNTSCLSCVTNYYLKQNQTVCLNQCPSSTYSFETSNGDLQCLSCPTSCLQCYDSNSCRACHSNSLLPYLQGTACQAACTDGYYAVNNSLTCEWCGWGCLTCGSSGICTQCSNSYLYGGVCQTQCPVGYYGSTSFSCEACISPCYDCFNAANCQFCISGYFLYLTHCLETCPANQWAILSLSICNQTCSFVYFKIPSNRTCVASCSAYYDPSGNCVDICTDNLMANQTLGCEQCSTADCTKMLYMQLDYYQLNGNLFVIIIFNLPIDNLEYFTTDSISLALNPAVSIDPSQLALSALRTLQETTSASVLLIANNQTTIADKSQYHITVQVNLGKSTSAFTGALGLTVKDLTTLTVGGYPLQVQNATTILPEYQTNNGGWFAFSLGCIISGALLLMFLVNYVCGNQRITLLAVDGIQTIHVLYYLSVWSHPLLENYMLGLRFSALRSLVSSFEYSASLWNCSPKYIVLYGLCNFYLELVLPALIILIFLLLAFMAKFIPQLEGKHKLLWNHINSIWWLTGMSLGLSAFTGLQSSISGAFWLSLALCALFLIFALILTFKIIENVYSKSFSDNCFFWDLKKKKAKQLSNLHSMLLIVRRIIVVVAVSVGYENPLSSLFVVTLLTLCILSNIIINRPFKNYGALVGVCEGLLAGILVLIQMYIVNTSRLSNQAWNGLGYFIFILVLAYTIILLCISVRETVKHINKIYRKSKQSNEGKNQTLMNEENFKEEYHEQEQRQHSESKNIADETQHHLMKAAMNLSPKEHESSHIFSETSEIDRHGGAPKLLIKIEKQSQAFRSLKNFESE